MSLSILTAEHRAIMGPDAMDRSQLIEQARQLRNRWNTGEYVSVSAAVSLANRLADAVETGEAPAGENQSRIA